MESRSGKYSCLEVDCKHQTAMRWTPFLLHQRVVHLKRFTIHFEHFSSNIEFQVWLKFVLESILQLPVLREGTDTTHRACDAGVGTRCPARLFAIMKTLGNKTSIAVVYMGEHYGHDHSASRMERLFLLNYFPFTFRPVDQWLTYFQHAGVFLQTQSTPVLRDMAQELAIESKNLVVVGFMNPRQSLVLKKFHRSLYLESHRNWIVLHSLIVKKDYSNPPLAIPVAYCYSNFMCSKIVEEFLIELRKQVILKSCSQIVTNDTDLFELPWSKASKNSENDCPFIESFQSLLVKMSSLLPNSVYLFEINELGKILKKCIVDEFPQVENIYDAFLIDVRFSETLQPITRMKLLESKSYTVIMDLFEAWIDELLDHDWATLVHERFFLTESFYITRAITRDNNLPKVLMRLSLLSCHILGTASPLEKWTNFAFTTY